MRLYENNKQNEEEKMKVITTKQIFKAIKRNILLIIVPAILAFALALSQTMLKEGKSFDASSILMVTGAEKDKQISYNNLLLNEKLSNIYGQFLESNDLYKDVSEKVDGDIEPAYIKENLNYEVNPQGGVITFTYNDTNKDRAIDTLTFITEDFRSYVKNYLDMDNIDYIQKPSAEGESKSKDLRISVAALLVGAMLGAILAIYREILSDEIRDVDDLKDMGVRVLGDLSSDYNLALYTSKTAINNLTDNSVIGITSIGDDKSTYDFSEELALAMSTSLGVCLVDSLSENTKVEKKYQSVPEDIKVLRYKGVDFIKLVEKPEKMLDSFEFEEKIYELKETYNYVLINESNLGSISPIISLRYEDYKIIVINSKVKREELLEKINQIEEMGTRVLGVIYNN